MLTMATQSDIAMSDLTLGQEYTDHPAISAWVQKTAGLCKPEQIFWFSNSEAEKIFLTGLAVRQGTLSPLDQQYSTEKFRIL
jgi:GTP-dependent phosphoenolpyruvate carboxykinase